MIDIAINSLTYWCVIAVISFALSFLTADRSKFLYKTLTLSCTLVFGLLSLNVFGFDIKPFIEYLIFPHWFCACIMLGFFFGAMLPVGDIESEKSLIFASTLLNVCIFLTNSAFFYSEDFISQVSNLKELLIVLLVLLLPLSGFGANSSRFGKLRDCFVFLYLFYTFKIFFKEGLVVTVIDLTLDHRSANFLLAYLPLFLSCVLYCVFLIFNKGKKDGKI